MLCVNYDVLKTSSDVQRDVNLEEILFKRRRRFLSEFIPVDDESDYRLHEILKHSVTLALDSGKLDKSRVGLIIKNSLRLLVNAGRKQRRPIQTSQWHSVTLDGTGDSRMRTRPRMRRIMKRPSCTTSKQSMPTLMEMQFSLQSATR